MAFVWLSFLDTARKSIPLPQVPIEGVQSKVSTTSVPWPTARPLWSSCGWTLSPDRLLQATIDIAQIYMWPPIVNRKSWDRFGEDERAHRDDFMTSDHFRKGATTSPFNTSSYRLCGTPPRLLWAPEREAIAPTFWL